MGTRAGEVTYVYTSEGHRRDGVWITTNNTWEYGTCLMEFKRVCPNPTPDIGVLDDDLGVPEFHVADTRSKAGRLSMGGSNRGLLGYTSNNVGWRCRTRISPTARGLRVMTRGRMVLSAWTSVEANVMRSCEDVIIMAHVAQMAIVDGWSGHDCPCRSATSPASIMGIARCPAVYL